MGQVLIILVAGLVYFLPTIIAVAREHLNAGPIFIVDLFFGWTLLGWVICLAWSFSAARKPATERRAAQQLAARREPTSSNWLDRMA